MIRETNPLPYLCGRICTAQCALNCNREHFDDPVAIRELKRFVCDWEVEHPNQSKIKPVPQTKEKVAIIGAGPGGLSAAYFLARMGYKPTIFEKGDKTGGVVRYGVPQYRLSDEALDRDIEFIKSMGVEIVLNKEFGPDFTLEDIWEQGFKSVFIAVGLYVPKTLRLEGEDLPNVDVAIDFLVEKKYKCSEWILHTRTRSSGSRKDKEKQNLTIKHMRKLFGGTFYNDWYGTNTYTKLDDYPNLSAPERGLVLMKNFLWQPYSIPTSSLISLISGLLKRRSRKFR